MDPFLMIEWVGPYVVVADPPRVGLAWRLEELESTTEDPEEVESDREVYDKGWRWCVCASRLESPRVRRASSRTTVRCR